MRVYCDTCVYIDLFKGRKGKYEDWAEFALQFFRAVRDKKYKLVISDWVFEEIEKQMGSNKELKELLDSFTEEHKILIERTKEDEREARKLKPSNYPDALHVVLAKKANAVYLVTRDDHFFEDFNKIIEITRPQFL